ncbi:MAG: MbnP family protein [Panacagrimonas sp.]
MLSAFRTHSFLKPTRKPFLLLACVLALASCSREERASVPVFIEVSHTAGDAALRLTEPLSTSAGSISVASLRYYLGQLRLRREDGVWFESGAYRSEAGDYVLVDEAVPESRRFEAFRVPPGQYDALEFQLGIDATRNEGGAQSGALDPAKGMYWTWKTGFIFFLVEGNLSSGSGARQDLTWHVGGDSSLRRTVRLPLPDLTFGAASTLHLQADLEQLFRDIDPSVTHTLMSADGAAPVADAFAAMFQLRPTTVASGP